MLEDELRCFSPEQFLAGLHHARRVREDTAFLIAASVERRGGRHLAGGSHLDAALIASILVEAALCIDCIARKSGIPTAEATIALRRIQSLLVVTDENARCAGCLEVTTVFRLGGR